jgi:hypothetical protein
MFPFAKRYFGFFASAAPAPSQKWLIFLSMRHDTAREQQRSQKRCGFLRTALYVMVIVKMFDSPQFYSIAAMLVPVNINRLQSFIENASEFRDFPSR